MTVDPTKVDVGKVLAPLKDFQRATVDYVFKRMYEDQDATSRFLVADEVGLGKTLVARGLIAKVIERLHTDRRVDIVYVCSNQTIAAQNLNRLNVLNDPNITSPTRLTLLPLELGNIRERKINLVSFTPGTTFNLRSSLGVWQERMLIYQMLSGSLNVREIGLYNLLQGNKGKEAWDAECCWPDESEIDAATAASFVEAVKNDKQLLADLEDCAFRFRRFKKTIPSDDRTLRNDLIGKLRRKLAHTCVTALEPDLVILDEFQRFKNLLSPNTDEGELAKALFGFDDVRMLLLSATPYRMYTQDADDEDHYSDFIKTAEFLLQDESKVAELKSGLRAFRKGLEGLGNGDGQSLREARDRVQSVLAKVIARTERVEFTKRRDALLKEHAAHLSVTPEGLRQIRSIDLVAQALDAGDMVSYWKSAPYLLSFMRDYKLKRELAERSEAADDSLVAAIANAKKAGLSPRQINTYRRIDPANASLGKLIEQTVNRGLWRLLWMPPTLAYWDLEGAFSNVPDVTKRLIFSSWTVAPTAISALCSYEAERRARALAQTEIPYNRMSQRHSQPLQFRVDHDEREDRSAGMPTLSLVYPCVTIAKGFDPLQSAIGLGPGRATLHRVQELASEYAGLIRKELVGKQEAKGRSLSWQWAALGVLDRSLKSEALDTWVDTVAGWQELIPLDERASSGFQAHINEWREVCQNAGQLGDLPRNFDDVLVEHALGNPAICALRSLKRITGLAWEDEILLSCAASIAEAFRSLFNGPAAEPVVRDGRGNLPYWRCVLQYCAEGNLQAVLDEYFHQLKESLGLVDASPERLAREIAKTVSSALKIRTSQVRVDHVRARKSPNRVDIDDFGMRCHFAMRLGELESETDGAVIRAGQVRTAFNSPFRPFVLATTSIGQEGLDFHPYCHSVTHWNLPSNPVDLEQREGRVHRYKGHAIRKNVVQAFGLETLAAFWRPDEDPWDVLFRRAYDTRPDKSNDLTPYWIYEGNAFIERHVPLLPFSREVSQLKRLKRSLAVYRLAFGQPRQEDLVGLLEDHYDGQKIEEFAISLLPEASETSDP